LAVQLQDSAVFRHLTVPRSHIGAPPWLFGSSTDDALKSKVDHRTTPLERVLHVGQGMQTGLNTVFGDHPKTIIQDWALPTGSWFYRARNSDINRWTISNSGGVLLYPHAFKTFASLPPEVGRFLKIHKKKLQARAACIRGDCEWWQYTWPLHAELYTGARIFCPYLATENRFALDQNGIYLGLTDTTVLFPSDHSENFKYFLGLLNSQLLTWRFRFLAKLKGGGIREYFAKTLASLPIKRVEFKNPSEKKIHDDIVNSVDLILKTLASNTAGGSAATRAALVAKHQATIDDRVFKLYGLDREDVEHVVNALAAGSKELLADEPDEPSASDV
jgi:hypothetical protein